MRRVSSKLRAIATLIKHGDAKDVRAQLQHWLWSESLAYGLRRDLRQPFTGPPAKIPISIRPLEPRDVVELLDVEAPGLSGQAIYERMNRLEFLGTSVPTCYVAVTEEDKACYMQWLIAPGENAKIRSYFGGLFPKLEAHEALLEHAFTSERFGGLGIMPCAMAQIAARAAAFGASHVITFVHVENIPALKGCKRAGFSPYLLRTERWRLFRRTISFETLAAGTPYPFEAPPVARAAASGSG
jgi:hypothetical protein